MGNNNYPSNGYNRSSNSRLAYSTQRPAPMVDEKIAATMQNHLRVVILNEVGAECTGFLSNGSFRPAAMKDDNERVAEMTVVFPVMFDSRFKNEEWVGEFDDITTLYTALKESPPLCTELVIPGIQVFISATGEVFGYLPSARRTLNVKVGQNQGVRSHNGDAFARAVFLNEDTHSDIPVAFRATINRMAAETLDRLCGLYDLPLSEGGSIPINQDTSMAMKIYAERRGLKVVIKDEQAAPNTSRRMIDSVDWDSMPTPERAVNIGGAVTKNGESI